MIVILSERKLSERIRDLEGINDTVEEITYKIPRYIQRLSDHTIRDYGVKFVGMIGGTNHGGIAEFKFDISAVGMNHQTGGFNFPKLIEGLNYWNPLAVTIEQIDIEHICSGPVATAMSDSFDQYAHTLQRLSISEIQPAIEKACLNYAWKPRPVESPTGDEKLDALYFQQEELAQLERAGVDVSAFKRQEAIDDYNRQQIDAETERQKAAAQDRYERMGGH